MKKKKVLSVLLSLAAVLCLIYVPSSDVKADSIDGYTIACSISKSSSSATASTSWYHLNGTRYAQAEVFFVVSDGSTLYRKTSLKSYSAAGSASATANANNGSTVIGGMGYHKVVYNGTTWEKAYSSTGSCPGGWH